MWTAGLELEYCLQLKSSTLADHVCPGVHVAFAGCRCHRKSTNRPDESGGARQDCDHWYQWWHVLNLFWKVCMANFCPSMTGQCIDFKTWSPCHVCLSFTTRCKWNICSAAHSGIQFSCILRHVSPRALYSLLSLQCKTLSGFERSWWGYVEPGPIKTRKKQRLLHIQVEDIPCISKPLQLH